MVNFLNIFGTKKLILPDSEKLTQLLTSVHPNIFTLLRTFTNRIKPLSLFG